MRVNSPGTKMPIDLTRAAEYVQALAGCEARRGQAKKEPGLLVRGLCRQGS